MKDAYGVDVFLADWMEAGSELTFLGLVGRSILLSPLTGLAWSR